MGRKYQRGVDIILYQHDQRHVQQSEITLMVAMVDLHIGNIEAHESTSSHRSGYKPILFHDEFMDRTITIITIITIIICNHHILIHYQYG